MMYIKIRNCQFFFMGIIFILLSNFGCSLQPTNSSHDKIDAVFKFYFKVLKLEVTDKIIPAKYPELYEEIIFEEDTLYTNKYVGEALLFMEEVTGIEAYIEKGDVQYSINKRINIDDIGKWERWYADNKDDLKWEELKKNKRLPPLSATKKSHK